MIRRISALVVGCLLCAGGSAHATTTTPPPPSAQGGTGPLAQQVGENEHFAPGVKAVVTRGHVDIGPRIVQGKWTTLTRDDSGAKPTWRLPHDVVLHIPDAAALPVPPSPDYAFLGIPAGQSVHVVPQTENTQVPWLGWNTQDPAAAAVMGRGAYLQLSKVEGPGHLALFLQDGSFGKPRPLWDSRSSQAQKVWADVNTHVHANWVFSQPGAYRVGLRWTATSPAGQQYVSDATLRFAVGAAGIAQSATLAALPDLPAGPDTAATASSSPAVAPTDHSADSTPWLLWGGSGGLLIAVLIGYAVWRLRVRARREEAALEEAAVRARLARAGVPAVSGTGQGHP